MSFRFRKSNKLGPFRLNFSKSGMGWSVGGKGYRYTKKANGGTRNTFTLPGTGISYVEESGGHREVPSSNDSRKSPSAGGIASYKGKHGCLWWFFIGSWLWIAIPVYALIRYLIKFAQNLSSDKPVSAPEDANADARSLLPPTDTPADTDIHRPTTYKMLKVTGILIIVLGWLMFWAESHWFSLLILAGAAMLLAGIRLDSGRSLMPDEGTPFYKSDWFLMLCVVFLPLVAIIIYLLTHKQIEKPKKILVGVLLFVWSCFWFGGPITATPMPSDQTQYTLSASANAEQAMSGSRTLPTSSSDAVPTTTTTETTTTATTTTTTTTAPTTTTTTEYVEMVWIPSSGSKYHSDSSCSGMDNPSRVPLKDAIARGYKPCKRCY